ncbi:hypothetical protein [Pseudomonas citronellolis]|uniref:hypothetical protein n=1 Tax=Pseudomonas citronellolis TaxID=53408 RepID=UPI00128F5864|nr:hypothetical protein [Pseudomonas citronellolis]
MASIEAKSYLAAWLLLVLPIMAMHLCMLMATTLFYGMSVAMFSHCRRRINRAALWLLLPLVSGFSAFTILLFYFSDRLEASLAIPLITLATVLGLVAVLFFRRFRILVALSSSRSIKADRFFFLFCLAGMLICTVISAYFSTSLILNTYVGEDSKKAVRFVATFTLGTLMLSLVPTFVFFTTKGSTYRRLAFGCAVTIVLFLAYLLLARGAMSSITYATAGNLEIRQTFSARFVLDDRISLADLDNVQWRTRLAPANRVEVEAFQLFAFGDVLLLCPSSLRRATLYELPRYSRQCLLTRSSKVDRKPPRPRYQAQAKMQPSWQVHAERLINWSLRGLLELARTESAKRQLQRHGHDAGLRETSS